ncbi:hypothetical protein M404DRAFT_1003610 [Pisolithus tinctorius Marx 270]|uniref:Uncharacterized protein n=1 Tax=Pisolithus tinctorius Marx 270 TaxID=870435 RepID=A0A0C3NHX7_PISTI|nr:hypothetical protein M404DRAFT_1003610 [Pisolithus tinctorius Marx 270]
MYRSCDNRFTWTVPVSARVTWFQTSLTQQIRVGVSLARKHVRAPGIAEGRRP